MKWYITATSEECIYSSNIGGQTIKKCSHKSNQTMFKHITALCDYENCPLRQLREKELEDLYNVYNHNK
jgi:hypothetical protein